MRIVKKIKPFLVDARGKMVFLLEEEIPITSALLITSKKGSVRSNHYHKKDTHFVYLLKGEMEYSYKDMSKPNSKKKKIIVREGELVFTPPMTAHKMEFLDDSVFIALTTEKRNQAAYRSERSSPPEP